MSIQIHNTLTKKKEDLPKGNIKMYTCGVTVYDVCHIGHARSLYIFDVMVRYLKYRGYKVKFVRNITDIDDKIINKAKELNLSAKEVAQKYTKGYYEDLKALGIGKADSEPKATENIPNMIKHIQGLIKKGYAYVVDGDVYFSVRKFKDYGKLSGQNLEQMMAGSRVEKDERKQDPLDFALWKKSKEGEPSWNSPWGGGRPGWHIECSVMSSKYLKTKTLDIHAGGLDLVFPHHENEIAQAEALTGKPFAKFWIHHGLLTINGQKMAKSLGNFVTIQDILKRCSSDVLKIFYLQTHYSNPIDFSWEKMEETKNAYNNFAELYSYKKFREINNIAFTTKDVEIEKFMTKFVAAMDDDFNTPIAISVLFDLIKYCRNILVHSQDELYKLKYANRAIIEIGRIFGLSIFSHTRPKYNLFHRIFNFVRQIIIDEAGSTAENEEKEIKELINRRNLLRAKGKYKEADEIRKKLESQGIILEDTKGTVEGTVWRRKL